MRQGAHKLSINSNFFGLSFWLGYPLFGPIMNSLYNGSEIASLFGQTILHAHRNLGIDHPLDDSLALKFAQAITQHAVRKPFDGRGHLAEALRPFQHSVEDQSRPAFAQQLDS